MSRHLKPKGITVKASLKNRHLQIMLEADYVPDQEALVAFIRQGMSGLRAESIKTVRVYGRQTGKESLDWNQEIVLDALSNSIPSEAKIIKPNAPLAQPIVNTKVFNKDGTTSPVNKQRSWYQISRLNQFWYETNPIIITLLLTIWSVGLYLMWQHSKWSKGVKNSVTGVLAIMCFVGLVAEQYPPSQRHPQSQKIQLLQ